VNAGRTARDALRPAFTAIYAVNAGSRVVRRALPALTGGPGPSSMPQLKFAGSYGTAGSRSAFTSAGSPRSGNGTSIASKSRGTTVLGNSARASSRTSRGK
jgi:hypothetical protein